MSDYLYTVRRVNSDRDLFVGDDLAAAEMVARRLAGPGCVIAGQWDADGWDADGGAIYRRLIWATEGDAANDDGARAVGEIVRRPPLPSD